MKKLNILLKLLVLLLNCVAVMAQTEKQIAFPGAEGFGRYTTGGRGGKVYHVTNLNDSGSGSLRWANTQSGPRTIVFDVSGTIMLQSALHISKNTTVAGQTAPGDGICIANYPVTLDENVIVRYVRFRLGNEALKTNPNAHEGDGLGAMDRKNIIVDHCSVSWSIDECLSIYGSKDITVQWCISAQSLVNAGHSKGKHGYGGNWGGSGASYHHNLLAHHTSRTPRLGPRPGTQTDERMDMRNNVIYNWSGEGCYGGEGMNVNIVNNYYKPGPGTTKHSDRIACIGIRTSEYTKHDTSSPNDWDKMWHVWGKFYVDGNVNTMHSNVTNDNWTYGIYNQIDANGNDGTYTQKTKDTIRLAEPITFEAVTTHTAEKAFDQVLKYAGASLHRDALDEIMVGDVRDGKATFTGTGNSKGFINSQDDVKLQIPTGWPELKQGEVKIDTDGDGMPDEWEDAHGLDKSNKADGNQTGDSGYTNLEIYMNSLVADITAAQTEDGEQMGYIEEGTTTYTLSITSTGNGSATYNSTAVRGKTQTFTVTEGSSATIAFTPDTGYRIACVKVNNADMTSQVANRQLTISNIVKDTNVEVSFEAIPLTTYSLTITATGNGAVTYEGQSIRGGSSTFTVVEGSYATVQISADDGYRLKRVMLGSKDVTTDVANGQYTTTKIMANMALTVEFEAIPTFSLVIKSSAFGSVKYGDVTITNQTETFTVREGTSAVLTFVPDGNGRLRQVTLNGGDITGELKNGQYTINDIGADQSVEAEYVEDITKVTDAGVAYTVTSYDEGTVIVAAGNYGQVLTVPATFTAKGKTWTVTGIDSDALADATELAAIIWEPEVAFTAQVSNPNLLLYVKSAQYAPSEIQNVVVNDQAENIILTEAASGNNFYCPKAFTARKISYGHNYSMISGYSACQGWETLVLPFDVSMVINAKGTELMPYSTWEYGNNLRPFWLYQLTENGWQASNAIKANVPYIISMPNNEMYESSYNQTGSIQFIGNNVQVMTSDEMTTGRNGNKRFVASYQNHAASTGIYALNVSNEWCQNTATEKEGSAFIRSLRNVHPFEAYMTVEGSNAPWMIPVFDGTTDVRWLMDEVRGTMAEDAWYDLQGRKLQGEPKQNGIYIYKGKKSKEVKR